MPRLIEVRNLPLQLVQRELNSLLRPGDIIFIAIDNLLYRRVAEACMSWTSHVGMVMPGDDGWQVYESSVPRAKVGPLDAFLERTVGSRLAVHRLPEDLDESQQRALRAAATERLGAWYNLGFNLDGFGQFCSRYVHEVYRQALGINIGCVQTFREMLDENPYASLTFWKFWYFGRIPWDRRTLTPESIRRDERLVTVFESY